MHLSLRGRGDGRVAAGRVWRATIALKMRWSVPMVGLLVLRVVGHGGGVEGTRCLGCTSSRYATQGGGVVASITSDAPLTSTDPRCCIGLVEAFVLC